MVGVQKRIASILIASCLLVAAFFIFKPIESDALTSGYISKVENVSSGIKVSWTKNSTMKGYKIYRKAGTSTTWSKVKTITSASTLNWTDKNVTNGKKYVYKVYPYNSKKSYTNSKTKKTYRLTRPTITCKSLLAGEMTVNGNSNLKASGYNLKYSTSSTFTNSKSKTISGPDAFEIKNGGLTPGKTYYVKARAYKTVSGVKYYSAYSVVKKVEVRASHTVYLNKNVNTLYVSDSTDSAVAMKLQYMTKATLVKNLRAPSTGSWYVIKYDGNTYYEWVALGKVAFVEEKSPMIYSSENKYRQEVIDKAMAVYKKDTAYVSCGTGGISDCGAMKFDCSGFVSYVLNKSMQEYFSSYKITSSLKSLYAMTTMSIPGYSSSFSVATVCEGKWDSSKVKPGDLIFFDEKHIGTATHVGLYLGNNEFIHCATVFDGVFISPMDEDRQKNFLKAKRFIP